MTVRDVKKKKKGTPSTEVQCSGDIVCLEQIYVILTLVASLDQPA